MLGFRKPEVSRWADVRFRAAPSIEVSSNCFHGFFSMVMLLPVSTYALIRAPASKGSSEYHVATSWLPEVTKWGFPKIGDPNIVP